MPSIPDKSIDMILCDLPYGTTVCKWDTIIPFEPLWEQYKRVIKDNGAIVLTASQPFTSALVMSNIKMFKYSWTWDKIKNGHPLNANKQPLRVTEDICVFYGKQCLYNPQKKDDGIEKGIERLSKKSLSGFKSKELTGKFTSFSRDKYSAEDLRYSLPSNIIRIHGKSNECNPVNVAHPTQKPVVLFEYLIKTYTNENETVLDNCSGSGTTAIACINTNRNYICIEKDKTYFDLSVERVNNHKQQTDLFKVA